MQPVLVISHPIHHPITETEVKRSLIKDHLQSFVKVIEVKPLTVAISDSISIDWQVAMLRQKTIFEEKIKPWIAEEKPDRIIYFGAAPIPLTVHLGYLFSTWENVEVYHHHFHVENKKRQHSKTWKYINLSEVESSRKPHAEGIPGETNLAHDDVLLRVATSFEIHPDLTMPYIEGVMREIDLTLNPERDISCEGEPVLDLIEAFKNCLDAITRFYPNVAAIRLFAAVPPPVAFLMGKAISGSIAKPIHFYQFNIAEKGQYVNVLTLQDEASGKLVLTVIEKELIKKIEVQAIVDLRSKIAPWITQLKLKADRESYTNWWEILFPTIGELAFNNPCWWALPFIFNGELSIESEEHQTERLLSEHVLYRLHKETSDLGQCLMASRLIIFRDQLFVQQGVIHHDSQLKLVEGIIDMRMHYKATVYALLHAWKYTLNLEERAVHPTMQPAKDLVRLTLYTIWSELDPGWEIGRLTRSDFNRLLTWYWIAAWLESNPQIQPEEFLQFLATFPLVEISGVPVRSGKYGLSVTLDRSPGSELAIVVYQGNKRHQYSEGTDLPLETLLQAFRTKHESQIIQVFKLLARKIELTKVPTHY